MSSNTSHQDTAMSASNTPPSSSPAHAYSNAFATFSEEDQATARRMADEIALHWGVLSAASAFPAQYHPDPEVLNWGVGVLRAVRCLARLTAGSGERDWGVGLVVGSIEMNEDVSDRVLRVEDVEVAIRKVKKERVRREGDLYRPVYGEGGRVPRESRQVWWEGDVFKPVYKGKEGVERWN